MHTATDEGLGTPEDILRHEYFSDMSANFRDRISNRQRREFMQHEEMWRLPHLFDRWQGENAPECHEPKWLQENFIAEYTRLADIGRGRWSIADGSVSVGIDMSNANYRAFAGWLEHFLAENKAELAALILFQETDRWRSPDSWKLDRCQHIPVPRAITIIGVNSEDGS